MTQPTPRPRGRPAIPREVQRRRLMVAAKRVFERGDYPSTRVADIVGEAGMSSRSFYQFFESKDDLIAQVVHELGRAFIEELEAIFEESPDPIERIDRGLRTFLDLFAEVPLDLEALGGAAGQRVRDARRVYVREITEMVVRELGVLQTRGRLSKVPDPVFVELILTGIEGVGFRYHGEGRSSSLRDLHPTVMDLLVRVFLT